MKSVADYYLKFYGYIDEDDLNLIQKSFWSDLRSSLYKKICKGPDGRLQWDYITGKRSRDSKGRRILLSEKNTTILQNLVDYYQTEEGRDQLMDYDIDPTLDHIDDLMGKLCEAPLDRDQKREEFKLFLKHKHEIMKFLLR